MISNVAFDSIAEININVKKNIPVVEAPAIVSANVYVGGLRCSGKNQKIVGNFYNSDPVVAKGLVEGMSTAKRAGLDMAINRLGLKGIIKATQRNGEVYLVRII